MSYKTFVAAVIGFIVVAAVALFVLSQSREQGAVMPESVPSEVSDDVAAPTENESISEPVPGSRPQGKINVQVACESALMYTTFTDGAAADAFVAECVEGKHPDVIERYIESLGIDGATI